MCSKTVLIAQLALALADAQGPWVRLEEAADSIGCKPQTLYQRLRRSRIRGDAPEVRRRSPRLLHVGDFSAWLYAREQGARHE